MIPLACGAGAGAGLGGVAAEATEGARATARAVAMVAMSFMPVKTRVAVAMLVACAGVIVPAAAGAQEPLGFAVQTFGRFDRDTLTPIDPSLALPEPHARPVYSPDGTRVALGLSAAGDRTRRIGVWIVDPKRMAVEHAIATGIAAEAVVYPGVVAALLQDGRLVVIDPRTGKIRR